MDEWSTKYGLEWDKRHDARHNSKAAMKMIKNKIKYLRSAGLIKNSTTSNIDPNEAYLIYLSWQQGTRGIKKIFEYASEDREMDERLILNNMWGNYYGNGSIKTSSNEHWAGELPGAPAVIVGVGKKARLTKGEGLTPKHFLKDWKPRFAMFTRKIKNQFGDILAKQPEEAIKESKLLGQLINLIERVEANELV
jgi:hypothetical protein